MNFTREPMIETVITPREGMKLLVRNSKGGQEEYLVESLEVVSFGQSLFFRSLERPKSFLVPVSDYEILELKEMRVPLKTPLPEGAIKIGGGRERPLRESAPQEEREHYPPSGPSSGENIPDRGELRRGKRRRGRRGSGSRHDSLTHDAAPFPEKAAASAQDGEKPLLASGAVEEQKAPSFISKLFPPPPTLIKDNLSRYKLDQPPVKKEDVSFVQEELEVEKEISDLPEQLFDEPEDEN